MSVSKLVMVCPLGAICTFNATLARDDRARQSWVIRHSRSAVGGRAFPRVRRVLLPIDGLRLSEATQRQVEDSISWYAARIADLCRKTERLRAHLATMDQ
jgi:hypothetical protein